MTQILFYCGLIETNSNEATGQYENEYKTTLRTKMTTRISHILDKNKIEYYNDQIMILASSIFFAFFPIFKARFKFRCFFCPFLYSGIR